MRKLYSSLLFMTICGSLSAQRSQVMQSDDTTFSAIKQLQEVTITAEKRELSISEIPVALSVISGKNLLNENTPDLRNLSGMIPNFYMQEGGLKLSTPLYVRGIGTVSGTPPVGLYVDGVPVFDKNAFIFDLYDIKQIEVLRGPQTTLYGRNSIIGLINIRTNPPASKLTLQAKAGVSSYNSQNYMVTANLPVRNVVYNKLSFSYNRTDGYFKNDFTGGKTNKSDSYNLRYQGQLYTNDTWQVALGINYNHSFDDGYAYHAIDSLKVHRYRVNYDADASYKRDLASAHVNARKTFDRTTLSWITSYSWTKDKQELDADFTFHDVFRNGKKSKQNLVTQEINYQSTESEKLDWTVGTFGFYKNLTNDYLATFGTERHLLLPLDLDKTLYYNNTSTWGIAGYGQVTLKNLLPGVFVTVGLRYDYEKASLDYKDSLLFHKANSFSGFHDWEEDNSYSAWLPKFSVLKKWNGQLSAYASIAKGYKAGGYNIIANDMTSQVVKLEYDKETLWNYEIGTKYFSQNGRFNVNAAIFYIDWKDQQIFVMEMMGPIIKNAGDARSFGAEMDLTWECMPHLTYFLSSGYSNSEYYHHLTKAYEGNKIVMAPEFTLNTGFSYQKKVKTPLFQSFMATTSVTGFGKQYFDEANTLKQNPYFLWNMNFGVSGKYIDFHVWGKNILNKAFFCYMFNSPVGKNLPEYLNSGQSGAPSRFGASITIKI
ncbi:TonB-dependent receptor [Butyricimonas hominis]|nr:TonB-dependent receptor [Butyricimonas hominis]